MKIEYIDGALLKKLFIGAANSLERNKESVNALNVFPVPDGDTGTNMSLTMQSAIKQINAVSNNDIDEIATAASNGSLMGARGNSGVILSQLFRGFANGLKGNNRIDTEILAKAFKLSADTAYRAVMKPTEGTILTVARECAEKAMEIYKKQKDIKLFLEDIIKHGDNTLQKTPEMLDVLKQAGVVDAGGKGLLVILIGSLEVLSGKAVDIFENNEVLKTDFKFEKAENLENIKFGYCTEFIINKTKYSSEAFKKKISKFGDSMLVVSGDDIIKVHIHTNNPGNVIQEALKIGELIDIKIDNMRYQHRSNISEDENPGSFKKEDSIEKKEEKSKKYSFISISMGEGFSNVFEDLKVDYIISGGQTMNPSTEDIMNAIDNVNGENIIILPNNSNIVLAANQAKKLSNKKIEVLPTKTVPQGIAALLAFNEDHDLEKNLQSMNNAIRNIKTGQVTFAVRDTQINDIKIKKDDVIGIFDGDIKEVGSDINEISLSLIKDMVNEDSEIITIFYGQNINEEDAVKLSEKVEEEIDFCDVEVIYGGQPLYYYLFSIE